MSRPEMRLDRSAELLPETRQVAERELRETPERVREALERLRELLKENPDLYYGDDDDIFTIFLRPCKWYPESALALMRRLAEFKQEHHSLLAGLKAADEKDSFLNHTVANVLKNRDHKNRRIVLVSCGATWDPKTMTVDKVFRTFYVIHLISMLEHETQINGVVMIMDFQGMGWSQAMAFTPASSKRMLSFIQDAMPSRLKELHMVHQPMVFNIVWNLFKPLLRQKLKSRIFFHGSKMSSLHKHISPSTLPADYDGHLPKIDYSSADWYPIVQDCEQHIQNMGSYGFVKST